MADMEGLPGGAELWKVGGDWFAVYTIPGTDVPLTFRFERDDLLEAAAGASPKADRTLSADELRKAGAIDMGVTSELDTQLGRHPWDSFLTKIKRDKDVAPWLDDPEVLAHVAAGWLRGEAPNLERTQWWQTKTDAERQWIRRAAANPAQAREDIANKRISMAEILRTAGATNVTSDVVNLLADNWTKGRWSETQARQQALLLSDPMASGTLDRQVSEAMSRMGEGGDRQALAGGYEATAGRIRQTLVNRLGEDNIGLHRDGTREDPNRRVDRLTRQVLDAGDADSQLAALRQVRMSVDNLARQVGRGAGGFDVTRQHEEEVRATVRRWLGPVHGDWSQQEITEWAGRLRNDPNAKDQLERNLRGLRKVAFSGWENEDVTYEQIAKVTSGMFQQMWGQTPDEKDPLFLRVANMTDHNEAAKVLRREGFDRGVAPVVEEATRHALAATGGQVRRAVGAR